MVKTYLLHTEPFYHDSLFETGMELLSPARRKKVLACRFRKDQNLSLAAGLLLQFGLAELGLDAKTLSFQYGPKGKPALQGFPHIHFNVSHSGQCALAVFADCAVGCDIQMVKELNLRLAERFFSPQEREYVHSFSDHASKIDAFYRIWALKESFIKATGRGLSTPLDDFCIHFTAPITVTQGGVQQPYFLKEYFLDGYKIACCAKKPEFVEELRPVHLLRDLFSQP